MVAEPDRTKAIPAFRRAVELDSSNFDAANSLAVTLNDVRDYAGAERAYRVALAGDPGNATILTNIAQMYMETGRHAAFDSVITVVERASAPFPTGPIRFEDLWVRRDYDGAERLARANADTAQPRRAVGAQDALVWIDMLRGRLREAERRYVQVNEAKARIRGDTVSPHDVAFFHAIVDGEFRGDVARGLAVLDAAQGSAPPASLPLTRDRSLFLALGYTQLGAPAKARALMNEREARLDASGRRQETVMLSRVRGEIARAEGKTDSAIAYFRRGDAEADGLPTRNCTVCTPFFLGTVFDRAGQADSARTYLTRYVEMTGTGRTLLDRYWLAPTLFRLGELYENAGDVRHATEYYGRFVDLWKNADPELQPRVAEARGRIDRLNRANR